MGDISQSKEVENSVKDAQKDITDLKRGGVENAQNLKMAEGKIEKQNIELTALQEKIGRPRTIFQRLYC